MNTPSEPTAEPPPWHALAHAPAAGTVLGQRAALADGQPMLHSVFAPDDVAQAHPFRVILLRSGQDITVYANRCAHFGVPLAATQQQLIFRPHQSLSCNVHYARYRWSDGVCVQGDCEGESLVRIPVTVDADGCIRIAFPG